MKLKLQLATQNKINLNELIVAQVKGLFYGLYYKTFQNENQHQLGRQTSFYFWKLLGGEI